MTSKLNVEIKFKEPKSSVAVEIELSEALAHLIQVRHSTMWSQVSVLCELRGSGSSWKAAAIWLEAPKSFQEALSAPSMHVISKHHCPGLAYECMTSQHSSAIEVLKPFLLLALCQVEFAEVWLASMLNASEPPSGRSPAVL